MKKSLLTVAIFLCFCQIILAQSSHLSLIYDFDGQDFDYSVKGMVGTNDSLYIISNTPNGQGIFFRIDENGEGYKVIWVFDDVRYAPESLVGNDTVIYGTTSASNSLFKYSLRDYSFEFVKDFDFQEVRGIRVRYLTDSVLWFLSTLESASDNGNIFSTNPDGTNLKKLYKATSSEQAQNPADFMFHENKVYIACWGGGNLYPNGDGTFTYSGSFIRINVDGTGYENIIPGGDHVGTQPQSVIIRENKLFGLFAYSGSHPLGAQFFRSNLDGTEYDSLGGLPERALTRLLSTDSLIYGISSFSIVGINPVNGDIRIFDDLLDNPDFGADIVSNPAYLNGSVFIAAQQGGPNGGGTILKWTNEDPEVDELYLTAIGGRLSDTQADIDLNELFTDPEGDLLSFSWAYDEASVTVTESNGVITLTSLIDEAVVVKITARDGWAGHKLATLMLHPDGTVVITRVDEQEFPFFLYPNPARSILTFSRSNVKSINILSLDGKICASYLNPEESIDISSLPNGIYFVRSYINGKLHVQKFIKH